MKVLVTGAAGYIGCMVVSDLLSQGLEVHGYDLLVYGGEPLLSHQFNSRFALTVGDVRDRKALSTAMKGCDAVIHLAGIVGEPACALDETAAHDINFVGSKNAFELSQELKVGRFLFVSTCSNYGVSSADVLATEESELHPISQYAKSKVTSEQMVLAGGSGTISTVMRLGTICGLSPRMRFDLLVSELARAAVLGETMSIFTPEAWRPFLHMRDACRVFTRWLETDGAKIDREVFNIIGENCQKRDLVAMVLRHFPQAKVEITNKVPDKRDYRADGTKIERRLGFTTRHTVEEAFLETARAVADGVFRLPFWEGHAAVPSQTAPLKHWPPLR